MKFYTYIYLDPRKLGNYMYEELEFDYEPIYVGKGKNGRAQIHLSESKNPFLNNIISKIKEQNQMPKIIRYQENLTEKDAFDLEIKLIKQIGRRDLSLGPLTNLTDGGDGVSGFKHSEKFKQKMKKPKLQITKQKISEKMKGRKQTKEQKRKNSESKKGEKNPMYGKTHVAKSKRIMSEKKKGEKNPFYGRKHTEESNQKRSESLKGRIISEVTKQKQSESAKRRWNKND